MRSYPVRISLVMVFILAAIDAYQDLHSQYEEPLLQALSILAVAVMAVLPSCLAVKISAKHEPGTVLSGFYWSAAYGLIFISICIWLFGVIQGESPASGASHMHLVFWPVLIGLSAAVLYFCCRIFGAMYRWKKHEGKT